MHSSLIRRPAGALSVLCSLGRVAPSFSVFLCATLCVPLCSKIFWQSACASTPPASVSLCLLCVLCVLRNLRFPHSGSLRVPLWFFVPLRVSPAGQTFHTFPPPSPSRACRAFRSRGRFGASRLHAPFSVAVEGLSLRACTLRSPGRVSAPPASCLTQIDIPCPPRLTLPPWVWDDNRDQIPSKET